MTSGWQTKALGEVLVKTESIDPSRAPDDEFEYIDVSSVSNETYTVEVTQRLKGKEAPSRARRLVRAGDVLLATIRPTLKRIAIVPGALDRQVCSTGYYVLRAGSDIDHRFLFYSLFTEKFMGAMETLQKGASYPAVTDAEVRAQPITFPSVSDQRRIVAILDEAFEGIAIAKANTEKNLRNARELFAGQLDRLLLGHPHSTRLAQICSVFADGDWIESKDQSQWGIRLVQTGNVGEGKFKERAEKARFISESTFKRLHCTEIFADDCLVSRLPDPVGRACLLPDTGERMITAVDCTIVRFDPSKLLPEFFVYYSQSSSYLRAVDAETSGTTRKRISRARLGQVQVPVPPMSAQSRIVALLDEISSGVEAASDVYSRKSVALDALKKSLLHQAFNGAL